MNVGALSFDGLMVEKCQPDLPAAEQNVLEKTGYSIDLVEKSLVPTKDDWAFYWDEKALNKIPNPYMQQIYLLYRAGQLAGLKRQFGRTA